MNEHIWSICTLTQQKEVQSTGTETCASYHIVHYKRKMHWTGTDGGPSSW